VVFIASDPGGCTLDATVMGERGFLEVDENKGVEKIGPRLDGKTGRWTVQRVGCFVNTLTTSLSE
jgi:hypothetical protein